MRAFLAAAAGAALWTQPAGAVTYVFDVKGWVPVEQTISYSQNQDTWPASCAGMMICNNQISTYLQKVDTGMIWGTSDDGINFTFSQLIESREGIWGTARYLGDGVYQGLSLGYQRDNCPCIGDGPFLLVYGETTNFSFNQRFPEPVPEPATWAMLLLGFGLIGGAMRSRRRQEAPRPSYF